MNEFNIYTYPSSEYQLDEASQLQLTIKMKTKVLHMKILFSALIACFMIVIAGLYYNYMQAFLILPSILLLGILPLCGMFYLRPPSVKCDKCGQKMIKELKVPKNKSGLHEFLVCQKCHTYLCTFRTPGRV